MVRSGEPNRALRGLLAEVGWTEDRLAGQVNAVAGDSGWEMRLDRRSVSHWLAGRRPRHPVPDLIAEAFSRELGRTVTAADVGLAPRKRAPDSSGTFDSYSRIGLMGELPQFQDVVKVLACLAVSVNGQASSGGAYSLAALAAPQWAQAAARTSADRPGGRSAQRIQEGQVATVEQMARLFSHVDTAFGGGRSRVLAAYLARDVAPRLHASGAPALRRRLLSATSQLTYLCGFMCFDDERQALAQRYYVTALGLAAENNDPAAYAVTLRAMSVQARILGHHRHAVQLAETAASMSRSVDPVRQAFIFGQLAVAAAGAGDRVRALSALNTAERRLNQATSEAASLGSSADVPMGAYHPAALAHQQAAMCALLGDQKGAISALTDSLRWRPFHERRSRAITCARLAELHLRQGHLEQAVHTWHAFLDDYPHLTSARATTALKTLRSRLRSHMTNPAAKKLLRRAGTA